VSDESKSWYLMTRPLFSSGFEDDEFWAYGQDGFQEVLNSFVGSDVFVYDKRIYSEPKKIRAIVQNKTSDVFNSTTLRQILCNIGILKCGQYIEYEGALWMVSTMPDNNRIYEKAVLWKCKHIIRFISPVSHEIVEYPVFSTNSTQYGTGEQEKKHITIGEDQHLVYIPYNDETIMLDDRFRFIMDKNKANPTVYRITRVDTVSYAVGSEYVNDGLIQWSVLQTPFNEATDNRDLMIANYFVPDKGVSESIPGEEMSITLTDSDGDFMLAVGERKQIYVGCVRPDGSDVDSFEYRLEYDFAEDVAVVESDDNKTIVVRAVNNKGNVGRTISIRAIGNEVDSEATIKIQIVNW